jgi:hypothetical protein
MENNAKEEKKGFPGYLHLPVRLTPPYFPGE